MNWRDYEHYIYYSFKEKYPECNIEFDKKIKGSISKRSRQVDVFIDGTIAGERLTIIVDCKFLNKKIDINIVESFLGFVQDVKGHKGILITNNGYTDSAYKRADNDQNTDVKLEIIEFNKFYPSQGLGAFIYKDEIGAMIPAPPGWVIDSKKIINQSILATILPHGLSLESAFMIREVMYCNIEPKKTFKTIEAIIEMQEEDRLNFDTSSTINISKVKLKRSDKLDGVYRVIYYPNTDYYDHTVFIEFVDFILYVCLVEKGSIKGKHLEKLYYVVNRVIPMKVINNISK